ncbi:MAG TPA: hypothetical protein PL001_10915, partial [Candidatus Kryptobacter bacterium]|nr:hypothetical protein [Candidatus Kryptobacter bacterium]
MKTKTSVVTVAVMTFLCMGEMKAQWVRTDGPSGAGGTVYSVAVKDSEIFAGTDAGIFESTDGGTSWTSVNSGLPRWQSIKSLAVKKGLLFAGTANEGVWVSSNGGVRWTNTC